MRLGTGSFEISIVGTSRRALRSIGIATGIVGGSVRIT